MKQAHKINLSLQKCYSGLVVFLGVWLIMNILLVYDGLDWIKYTLTGTSLNRLVYNSVTPRPIYPNSLKKPDYFKLLSTNSPDQAGENGLPVELPESLAELAKERYKENGFNVIVSDMIAPNRFIPDQRQSECREKYYSDPLPTTSVIIILHNEANSTLLRTLTSIVTRSPLEYIAEIIIVDDATENRPYLYEPLDEYIKVNFKPFVKVKVIHNLERQGLIRSRMIGVRESSGETLTFLDAHVECSPHWLPPLLHAVKQNRKAIVSPHIDIIHYDTFEYQKSIPRTVGVYGPDLLEFMTDNLSEKDDMARDFDPARPYRTPTIAGGLFIVDKEFFYQIGTYDEQMEIWGAENIEISLRAWMCGGSLLIHPCSRVAHVFRSFSPYTFPGGVNKILSKNLRRLVDVWVDDERIRSYLYKTVPGLSESDPGDLSERIELKKRLKCQSFRWFVENVYPNSPVPSGIRHMGQISNSENENYCISSPRNASYPRVDICKEQSKDQIFLFTDANQITSKGNCMSLEEDQLPTRVKFSKCNITDSNQLWTYKVKRIRNKYLGGCMSYNGQDFITLVECDDKDKKQEWMVIE